jgi:hypothetical protein
MLCFGVGLATAFSVQEILCAQSAVTHTTHLLIFEISPVCSHRATPAISLCFVVAILLIHCLLLFKEDARLIFLSS